MKQLFFVLVPVMVFTALISSCSQPQSPVKTEADYRHMGDSIIKATFDTLRNALTTAMQTKGVSQAVHYCNENAYPITATLASENITIKRVAEKYRNPQNAPDSIDAIQWNIFLAAKAKGDSLRSVVITEKNLLHYYKPILLQPTCISCHGDSGKDIPQAVINTIDSLYPRDKARDFAVGDLRGMWKISFNTQSNPTEY